MRASAGSLMHNFKKEISFKRQSLRQRRLGGVADETLDVGERFRRMRRQAPRNLHRAIESLAADVSCTRPFLSASRGETGTPMRMCMSAAAVPMVRGSLCVPPAPGQSPKFVSGKPIW